jgi:hypothetical protein
MTCAIPGIAASALGQRGSLEQLARERRKILSACAQHDPDRTAGELDRHLVSSANIVSERLVGEPLVAPELPPGLGAVSERAPRTA